MFKSSMYVFSYLPDILTPTIHKFCNIECNLPQEAAIREKCFTVEQIALTDNFFLKSSLSEGF